MKAVEKRLKVFVYMNAPIMIRTQTYIRSTG